MLILRHAWLNLWDKHMTTGRINQVMCTSKPSPSEQACKCHQYIQITRIIPSRQEPLKEPLNQSHIFPFTNLFIFATLLPQVLMNQFTLQLSHHPFLRLATKGSKWTQDTPDSTYHFNSTHKGVEQRSRIPHCRIADPSTLTRNLNQTPYQAAPADTRKDKKQTRAIRKFTVSIIFPGPAKRRNKISGLSYCVFARPRRKRSAKNDF